MKTSSDMIIAWNKNEKISSFNMIIKITSLISDTDNLLFYPSKFVLVSDELNKFGMLIYNRLRKKNDEIQDIAGMYITMFLYVLV